MNHSLEEIRPSVTWSTNDINLTKASYSACLIEKITGSISFTTDSFNTNPNSFCYSSNLNEDNRIYL